MREPYDIIIAPVVTEKSTLMQSERNKFTFEVADSANKLEVKRSVEQLFGVKVTAVRKLSEALAAMSNF